MPGAPDNPTEREAPHWLAGVLILGGFYAGGVVVAAARHARDGFAEVFARSNVMPALIMLVWWPLSLAIVLASAALVWIGIARSSGMLCRAGFALLGLFWFVLAVLSARFTF